eukprot:TRINITY_DN1005_c0_g1_i2.p1 TRINITY_DN1005_c0_g1~~TRINITY_DN1005_c0_g1_i2.p1  ORF type:complete len:337 (+),score=82.12 TRINITY_DN1005_c0_g1_i2:148-1158(+)
MPPPLRRGARCAAAAAGLPARLAVLLLLQPSGSSAVHLRGERERMNEALNDAADGSQPCLVAPCAVNVGWPSEVAATPCGFCPPPLVPDRVGADPCACVDQVTVVAQAVAAATTVAPAIASAESVEGVAAPDAQEPTAGAPTTNIVKIQVGGNINVLTDTPLPKAKPEAKAKAKPDTAGAEPAEPPAEATPRLAPPAPAPAPEPEPEPVPTAAPQPQTTEVPKAIPRSALAKAAQQLAKAAAEVAEAANEVAAVGALPCATDSDSKVEKEEQPQKQEEKIDEVIVPDDEVTLRPSTTTAPVELPVVFPSDEATTTMLEAADDGRPSGLPPSYARYQ